MKNLIFITIALVLIANIFTAHSLENQILDEMADRPQKEIFHAFHNLHKKTYNLNSQEGLDRYRIFKENVAWIKAENNKLGKTIYGITQFTDMTHEEFVEKQLLKPEAMEKAMRQFSEKPLRFLEEKNEKEEKVVHHYHVHHHYYDNQKEESKRDDNRDDNHNLQVGDIDHRQYDNAIKNQGGCGSCWAFAVIGAIENIYHRLTGNLTTFSEQYLVNCDEQDSGCNGGWPTETLSWIKYHGVIEDEVLPYEGYQGWCNRKLAKYEYKIINGYDYPDPRVEGKSWDDLLAKGPMVVAMDASFRGFGQYRPDTFEPIRPQTCDLVNHAVIAVGKVTENGEEFLIVRNSWGTSWGYKGYFKIPRNKNCSITSGGWLPLVVKAKKPDVKPDPEPEPSDCIEIYGQGGFRSKPLLMTCDSVPELERHFFYGVKLPRKNTLGKAVKVMVFPWEECTGRWAQPVEESTEYIKRDGSDAYPASLAIVKEPQPGCINFYTEVCHKGKPSFTICEDIKDTQLVNFTTISQVQSILPDNLAVERVSFFTEPNFEGSATVIDGNALYNIKNNSELRSFIRRGNVRSVKINKN